MRYRVSVPPATSSRWVHRVVFVTSHGGFTGLENQQVLPAQPELQFELPIPHRDQQPSLDAPFFTLTLREYNGSRTRQQSLDLIPQPIAAETPS